MSKVVPISEVQFFNYSPNWDLRKVKQVLLDQGMIEPLTVVQDQSPPYALDGKNVWHDRYLAAAKELGWDTVIVALDDNGFES